MRLSQESTFPTIPPANTSHVTKSRVEVLASMPHLMQRLGQSHSGNRRGTDRSEELRPLL